MTYPTGTTQSDLDRRYNTPPGYWFHSGDQERPDRDGYFDSFDNAVGAVKEWLESEATSEVFEIREDPDWNAWELVEDGLVTCRVVIEESY